MTFFDVDTKTLEYLRKVTKLNPSEEFKVIRARQMAEELAETAAKPVNYASANDLEYQFRKNAYRRGLEMSWAEYINYDKKGIGLDEYTSEFLDIKCNGIKK